MSKSILKSSGRKTRKSVLINPNFNEVANDNPEPITPTSKTARWSTDLDAKMNRAEINRKKREFKNARRSVATLAAMTARRKYNIPSPDSASPRISANRTARSSNLHSGRTRTNRVIEAPTRGGPITKFVGTVFNFFTRKR